MQGAVIFSFVWGIVCFGLACLNIPGMRKGNPGSWVGFVGCILIGIFTIVQAITYL